jgi:hypothetical protein
MTDQAFASSSMTSADAGAANRKTARIAGVFYLLVAIFGGFAEGYVEPKMYAPDDAATAAQNLLANAGLVRAGVVADLLDQAVFVLLAVTLYALLKHVNRGVAMAMLALVAVAAAIGSLNAVFLFEGLQVVTGGTDLIALGAGGVDAMALLLLDMQHYGLLAAQVFFGLWLAPLGYLAFKSGQFSKPLGVALIVAAGCYLVDVLAAFLVPALGQAIHGVVVIPCAIAEIWMVLYLLAIGVRELRPIKAHTGDVALPRRGERPLLAQSRRSLQVLASNYVICLGCTLSSAFWLRNVGVRGHGTAVKAATKEVAS